MLSIESTFLFSVQSSDLVVWSSLNWTGPVHWSSGPVQFELDRTGPVQWSSGPVQFELDGRTGPIDGVFLGGVSQFFFSISSGPDRTSPVIQWSGPVWTGRTDRSDWGRLSRGGLSIFFSISSGPDRTSPVIQWSSPLIHISHLEKKNKNLNWTDQWITGPVH